MRENASKFGKPLPARPEKALEDADPRRREELLGPSNRGPSYLVAHEGAWQLSLAP